MCGCFDNCVVILAVSVLVFTVFLYCFVYTSLLFILSVLVSGLLPPSENSITVSNSNNNNNIIIIIHENKSLSTRLLQYTRILTS